MDQNCNAITQKMKEWRNYTHRHRKIYVKVELKLYKQKINNFNTKFNWTKTTEQPNSSVYAKINFRFFFPCIMIL